MTLTLLHTHLYEKYKLSIAARYCSLFKQYRGKYGCNLYNVSYIDNELDQQPEDTLLVVNIRLYEGIQMKTKIPQHGNWQKIVE